MPTEELPDPRDPRPPRRRRPPRPRGKRALAQLFLNLAERLSSQQYFAVEYGLPDTDEPRYGWTKPPHARLSDLLAQRRDAFRTVIALIESYSADLARIGRDHQPKEPSWSQPWFSGVSAAALYTFLRDRNPQRMIEIGSGNSTLFAARAIRDGRLRTKLASIDPQPRAEVDAVCDEVIRAPFESVDPDRFAVLEAGDIVLVDSSHYALMNSDVTAFFMDALPRIPARVLIGVHDIFVPDDYPWWLADRRYSEQYMLATTLLAGEERFDIVMADHYTATDSVLRPELEAAWARMGLTDVLPYGSCFWFEPADGH
jgi:hypothetical protein